MPIKDKDFGKYKRPDIFIEEIDNAITELPVQNVLINLVPGFSKKGPFNAPIYMTNPNDFTAIFGDDDRRLENKGSFFHKTVKQMLKNGPVWALNLLATNPNRDKVDWQSISVSSQYQNSSVNRAAYESFYNRQDFWERDTDAFLNVVKANNSGVQDNERLFHITNMGDKDITCFMYKSQITGFDVTAEEWYGDRTKVPAYIDYREWISDYMVSLIVVAGDWSDYKTLSNDTTFGKYFNTSGLIKGQVNNFLNERTVTVLAKYDCSLIPYFKDLDNRDMYIKSVVNNNTDKTGLFCTYNEDSLLEADFKLGNLDIIGDVIVGQNITSIDFMSYSANLQETVTYTQKYLDSSNNVMTNNYNSYNVDYLNNGVNVRTGAFTNGNIFDIFFNTGATSTGSTTCSVQFTTGSYPYYVINGSLISGFTTYNITLSSITYATNGSRYDVLYLTNDNTINILYGANSSSSVGAIMPDYTYSLDSTIILGYVKHVLSGGTYTLNYTGVSVDKNGYIPIGGTTGYGTTISNGVDSTGTYMNIEFNGTSGKTGNYSDYFYLRTLYSFNQLYDYSSTETGTVLIQNGAVETVTLTAVGSGYTAGEVLTLVGGNNACTITIGISGDTTVSAVTLTTFGVGYSSGVYQTVGSNGTGCTVTITIDTDLSNMSKVPITSIYSVHASSVINAAIKFYVTNPSYCYSNNTFLLYYTDNEFLLHDTAINTDSLRTRYNVLGTSTKIGIVGKYSTFYQNYYNGIINNLDYFYINNNSGSTKIYLKMFIDQNNILNVDFIIDLTTNTLYEIVYSDWIDATKYNKSLVIHSYKSSWEQSVDIINWIESNNDLTKCQQIEVDKDRYSEITKGGFLAAYYDESNWQAPDGPGYLEGSVPRKLTRIIKVQNNSSNVNTKFLYTDAPIKIVNNDVDPIYTGTTWSTMTYPTMEQYVDEYKALKISPFVVNIASIPDGTDERQNSILNIINKDTNLAKALADKNKITWRYLVDPWGLGLKPIDGYGSKQQLADLCGMKLNSLGFLNMPSAKIFRDSTNPSFVNDDSSLNLEYVKTGADETKNPDYYYQFAQQHGDIDGRSTVGYFFPYVRIYDNGIPKWVPPSAYAATTYMMKFTSNVAGMVPWTICAGITNGRIQGITKTEMDFTNTDLEYLYQMNANPIVYKLNNGYCINSESTAQVFPYSSLSFMHSREVLIELENRLYDMLLRYQWSFNTPEIRAEIKYRADKICKDILDSNGFYDFWNVCDETNNTDYVIDLQMGVLDTYVEIIKGMGIIVNNITILKKGDIQSMGFK